MRGRRRRRRILQKTVFAMCGIIPVRGRRKRRRILQKTVFAMCGIIPVRGRRKRRRISQKTVFAVCGIGRNKLGFVLPQCQCCKGQGLCYVWNNPGERKTKETKNLTENSLCCVWVRTKQTRVCSSAMPMLPKAKVLLSSSGSLAAQYLVFANKPLRGSSLHGSAYGPPPPGFNSTPLHTAVCI